MEALFQQHPQWNDVVQVCKTLQKHGYEAVLAGGCVRDALLGKLAKDMDIATSATPEQIEKIFPKVVMVGKSFGVCRVVMTEGLPPLELATFREESGYQDGRRPDHVVYSDMKKDSARRDFTVNAMFYDLLNQRLIDDVNGKQDLHDRVLRTVGVAEERFGEDSLRLLRAARFAAQLEFVVEAQTLEAVRLLAPQLSRVSFERRQDEVNKSFAIEKPYLFFKQLSLMNLQDVLFPGLVWNKDLVEKFFSAACPVQWGWAALVMLGEERAVLPVVTSLKVSKDVLSFIGVCLDLRKFLEATPQEKKSFRKLLTHESKVETSADPNQRLAQFVVLMQKPQIHDAVAFMQRYLQAVGKLPLLERWNEWVEKYAVAGSTPGRVAHLAKDVSGESAPAVEIFLPRLPEALLVGKDLLAAGVMPGPALGEKLQAAYLLQLQKPSLTHEQLLKAVL